MSPVTFEGKITQLQWLMFQASGQGYVLSRRTLTVTCGSSHCFRPYFGQAIWFIRSHPERIPSAIERYQKEVLRVFGVLESVLSKQEWLVGEKYTVADLSFIPYV